MKILQPETDQPIEIIHHLADIHIRNDRSRHAEYKRVFKKLFTSLAKETRPAVTVVCGDIVHNKTILRPECIELIKYFFSGLAKITDVVVILGNHDCNINNQNSLDSLTPILSKDFVTPKNIYLLKHGKQYQYKNILFGVTTIHSQKVTRCKGEKKGLCKVALYHGMLKGAKLDNDYQLTNNSMFTQKDFADYDYVLLGDIHKHQYLNQKRTIAYPSSLVQQNFGETFGEHGYIDWDLTNKTSEFIQVENSFGYLTCYLDENGLREPEKMPKYPRIRLIYKQIKKDKVLQAEDVLKKRYPKSEIISYRDVEAVNMSVSFGQEEKQYKLKEIKNQEMVKEMIRDFLHLRNLPGPRLARIMEEIEVLAQETQFQFSMETRRLQLKKLTFDNLFSYGLKNEINFERFSQVVGLVAKNGHGKSSIIDAILYGIYGKYSRGERYQAVNMQRNKANCELELTVNDQSFSIERHISRSGSSKAARRRNRYEITLKQDGKVITDDEKLMTSKLVEKKICKYDDLVNTSFILQYGNNFLDLDGSKKKEYLCRLWGLDVISHLMKRARFKTNSLRQTVLQYQKDQKKYDEDDSIVQLQQRQAEQKRMNQELKTLKQSQETVQKKIEKLQMKMAKLGIQKYSRQEWLQLQGRWQNHQDLLDEAHEQYEELQEKFEEKQERYDRYQERCQNLSHLPEQHEEFLQRKEDDRKKLQEEREQILTQIVPMSEESLIDIEIILDQMTQLREEISHSQETIQQYRPVSETEFQEWRQLEKRYQRYLDVQEEIKLVQKEHDKNQTRNKQLLEKLERLKDHQYNPKCEACMNNQVTQEKLLFEEELNELKENEPRIRQRLAHLHENLESWHRIPELYHQMKQKQSLQKEQKQKAEQAELRLPLLLHRLEQQQQRLETQQRTRKQKKKNERLQKSLGSCQEQLEEVNARVDKPYEDYLKKKDQLVQAEEKYHKANQKLQNQKIVVEKLEVQTLTLEPEYLKFKEYFEQGDQDELSAKLEERQNEIKEINQQIEKLQSRLQKLAGELGNGEQQLKMLTELKERIGELENQKDVNDQIAKLLDKNGLMEHLLNHKILPQLQQQVNQILSFVADFSLILSYDHSGVKVFKDVKGEKLDSAALCGFERFITNISFRLAFNQLNGRVKTDFLIIDEGFSCCDEENTGRLKALFDFIRRNYRWCLVITHLEEIKNNFDTTIQIGREDGISSIRA